MKSTKICNKPWFLCIVGESVQSTVTTSASSTQPMERPDNGDAFIEVAITTQKSQEEVVKTTTVHTEQKSETTTLSDHHHTASNSPVDVTSFIKARFPYNVIIITAILASVILLGLISAAILLLVIIFIRRARHRGEKERNFYDNPDTLRPPGDDDLLQR